jgi:hypothetical protein
MKANLLIFVELFCAISLFGQGSIQFNNRVTGTSTSAVVAPIYGIDPNCPDTIKYGNPATAATAPIPVGTQVYGGAPLVGSGFTASIWARVAGTQNAFVQAATTPFRTTTSSSLSGFWTVPTLAVVLQNVPSDPAVHAEIIIRVWDNVGGTITSWAQAIDPANTTRGWGESLPFVVADQLGGGTVLPPTLKGLESFQLHTTGSSPCIPEPGVIALGVLGTGCLFMSRRRK